MFVAMGDPLYPSHFGRTHNYDGFTPQSAVCDFYHSNLSENCGNVWELLYSQYDQVSSFNSPLTYDPASTTPTSLNADSPVLINKTASTIPWGREQTHMNYPMRDTRAVFNQNANTRMKSNAKDSPLSLHVPQISDVDLGLGFSPYIFDSPQNPNPPTPYWGNFGVSAPVTSPTASIPSNAHSTPQLTNASTPSMNHSTPINHSNAPILTTPTPGQLRPGKRTHEPPIKTEHPAMQFQHRPAQQHSHSPHHFNPPTKRESPPLSLATSKRRKPSGPTTPFFEPDRRTSSADTAATAASATLQRDQSQRAPLNSQVSHYIPTDEENLLLHIRDEREPKPDWKKTAAEFNEKMGKNFRVPALQMRYSRLKERLRVWTEKDVSTASLSGGDARAAVQQARGYAKLTASDQSAAARQGRVREDKVGEHLQRHGAGRVRREVDGARVPDQVRGAEPGRAGRGAERGEPRCRGV